MKCTSTGSLFMAHNSLIITQIITSVWNQVQGFNNCEIKESIFARYDYFWLLSIGEVRQLTNYSTIGKMVNTNVKSTFDTMKISLAWQSHRDWSLVPPLKTSTEALLVWKWFLPFQFWCCCLKNEPVCFIKLSSVCSHPRLPAPHVFPAPGACNSRATIIRWDHLENQAAQKL